MSSRRAIQFYLFGQGFVCSFRFRIAANSFPDHTQMIRKATAVDAGWAIHTPSRPSHKEKRYISGIRNRASRITISVMAVKPLPRPIKRLIQTMLGAARTRVEMKIFRAGAAMTSSSRSSVKELRIKSAPIKMIALLAPAKSM